MKSLVNVKAQARELREAITADSEDLFQGLVAHLRDRHGLKVEAVDKDVINGEGELSVDEGKIFYNRELDNDPVQRLLIVAHEMGHLALHDRLKDELERVDQLSPYFNTAGPALARYNQRSREEIEADAFANEFVLPSRLAFDEWGADSAATTQLLAEKHGLSESLIMSRLAEALYEEALVKPEPAEQNRGVVALDDTQLEAARHTGTAALVDAGPGTGKTATLIMRIDYLIDALRANPRQMLVLTFSNEAAEELRERIENRFGLAISRQIEITTFHGFGHAALRDWENDLDPDFVILDEPAQEELVYKILGGMRCDEIILLRDPEDTSLRCVRQITKLKERGIGPDQLDDSINAWAIREPQKAKEQARSRKLAEVFRAYEAAKMAMMAVDFADLINIPVDLLRKNTDLIVAIRQKYKWVMVDEYQDVSRSVADLLGHMCGPDNPPWVVGDLRQAIYVFCGAAPENVTNFQDDFPGARIFHLDTNYRSCEEVIEIANQLAELMQNPDKITSDYAARWTRGADIVGLAGENIVKIAQADSDAAEYDGVAAQVAEWVKKVPPEQIGVLARRNKDVRSIAVELSKRGLKVTTPGLITADGSAGVLACLATYLDHRCSALPRVVAALASDRFDHTTVNRAVEILSNPTNPIDSELERADVKDLIERVERLDKCLEKYRASGDAFTLYCSFLFDGSDYLRRILADGDEARRNIAFSEIISVLSWAVGYRYSHPGIDPVSSRLGFGQYFRRNLTTMKPTLAPPRAIAGSIQLMTCHASKGLEFACVALAGQTESLMGSDNWLPPDLTFAGAERLQPDSVVFVGATRAKESLLISYSKTARRTVVPLLDRWMSVHHAQPALWVAGDLAGTEIEISPVWGYRSPARRLSSTRLDPGRCGVQVYIHDVYDGRFPTVSEALYPRFFGAVRSTLKAMVWGLVEKGNASADDAEAIFDAQVADYREEPYFDTYRRRGIAYCRSFAEATLTAPRPVEIVDTDTEFGGVLGEDPLAIRYGIAADYLDNKRQRHVVIFRPETPSALRGAPLPDEINWSSISKNDHLPLVMLRESESQLQPWLFIADQQALRKLKWNKKAANMDDMATEASTRRADFSGVRYTAKLKEFDCENRCQGRPNCPYWMARN